MCTDSLTCWPGLNRVNETDLSHILPEQAGFSCSDFVLRCFKHPSKYASRQCGYLHVCEWRYLGFSWYRDEPITFLHVFPYIFNLCPSSWVRCQEVWPFFSQALDFIYSEARCWCGCCGEKCSKDTQSNFWHPTTSIKCALSTLYNNRLCQSSPGPGPQWRKCSAFVAMRANPSSDGTSPCVLNILDTVRKHTSRTVNNSWGRCIADQISFPSMHLGLLGLYLAFTMASLAFTRTSACDIEYSSLRLILDHIWPPNIPDRNVEQPFKRDMWTRNERHFSIRNLPVLSVSICHLYPFVCTQSPYTYREIDTWHTDHLVMIYLSVSTFISDCGSAEVLRASTRSSQFQRPPGNSSKCILGFAWKQTNTKIRQLLWTMAHCRWKDNQFLIGVDKSRFGAHCKSPC